MLKTGDPMKGNLGMSGNRITGLLTNAPTSKSDAASVVQVEKVVTCRTAIEYPTREYCT